MTLQNTPIPELEAHLGASASREQMEKSIDQTLERLGIAELVPDFLRESMLEGARRSQEEQVIGEPHYHLGYILNEPAYGITVEPNWEYKAWPDFLPRRVTGPGYVAQFNQHTTIYFQPSILAEDAGKDRHYGLDFQAETIKDKSRLLSLLTAGNLQYITLAEAGFIPKPDIIHGATHEGMLAIAKHFGLKTLEEYETETAQEPVDEGELLAMAEAEHEMLDLNDELSHEFSLPQKFAVYWLHAKLSNMTSGIAKQYHEQRMQDVLDLVYDTGSGNGLALADVAYGTFDMFKHATVGMYKRTGHKLINRNADFITQQLELSSRE